MGTGTPHGKKDIEERVKDLENRLDQLLTGKVDLTLVEVKDLQVSPKSKLRVACE
jgi:hypothetical protein